MVILQGKVLKGEGYGRKLGFPTANIDRKSWSRLQQKPKLGVYAGTVVVGAKVYKAGIVVGPVDTKGLPKLEAHLIGFKGNLYGKSIAFGLHQYLHAFRKYKNEAELKAGIGKDVVTVSKLIKL